MSRLLAILAMVGVLLPAAAYGARAPCEAPPGTSALEQYCATLPGAKGNGLARANPNAAVNARRADQLRRSGADGSGLLSLPRGAPVDDHTKSAGTKSAGTKSDDPGGNPVAAVGSSADSGSSIGGGYILLLAAAALLVGAAAWWRFRREGPGAGHGN